VIHNFRLILVLCAIFQLISCTNNSKVIVATDVKKKVNILISLPDTSVHFSKYYDSLTSSYWEYLHHFQYSGVALIAKNDTFFTWRKGLADSAKKLTLDMPMQIASASKPFCAVAIMKLVYTNKLKLSDTLRQFFPQLPYYNITIEQLLSHSSGLPEYVFFTDHFWESKSIAVTNKNLIPFMEQTKPEIYFKPGLRHKYTNTNFVLLACIIEKITGKTYPNYLKEIIFTPLGMKDTRVLEPNENFKNLTVKGHYGNGDIFQWDFQDGTYGDKNIISTVWDLYRFYQGLRDNILLPENIKNEMFKTRWTHTRGDADYCLGWRKREHYGEIWIFHTGWWHGFRSNFFYCLNSNKCAITLSNRLSGGFIKGNVLTSICYPEEFKKIMDGVNKLQRPALPEKED
jgi:CubicO group peptidase (beta-lactamase class C family)